MSEPAYARRARTFGGSWGPLPVLSLFHDSCVASCIQVQVSAVWFLRSSCLSDVLLLSRTRIRVLCIHYIDIYMIRRGRPLFRRGSRFKLHTYIRPYIPQTLFVRGLRLAFCSRLVMIRSITWLASWLGGVSCSCRLLLYPRTRSRGRISTEYTYWVVSCRNVICYRRRCVDPASPGQVERAVWCVLDVLLLSWHEWTITDSEGCSSHVH